MNRRQWTWLLGVVTVVWIAVCIISLRTGWLNSFFYDTHSAHIQAIDFFPVERAWLNFMDGRSQYDTFHSSYGPYATWYLYHPALALVIGPLLMAFSPWAAYGVWTALSVVLMAVSAAVIARQGKDSLRRVLVVLLLLGSFPTFILLHAGNVQAIVVLALSLVLASVESIRRQGVTRSSQAMLLAGLLISLFSKPFVLAMFPLLLLMPETRRSALRAVVIYFVVSVLLVAAPGFNPVAMSWSERWDWLTHPALVQQAMNVYTNGFTVTKPMQDNVIHWLAMFGLSDFRFLHIDVYSLPVFLDGWLRTHTPDSMYRVPALLVLEVSLLVGLMRNKQQRIEAALLTLMASSLLLFLSYGLVWEYHFAGVLPVIALLLMREHWSRVEQIMVALGALVWMPSLYILFRNQDARLLSVHTALHAERLVPVVILFILLLVQASRIALTSPAGLYFLTGRARSDKNQAASPFHEERTLA